MENGSKTLSFLVEVLRVCNSVIRIADVERIYIILFNPNISSLTHTLLDQTLVVVHG
jgi:hypothetical protein